jgi:hypothetical protein
MSRTGHRSWLTGVAVALALSVTGCAGGGDEATDAATARRAQPAPRA